MPPSPRRPLLDRLLLVIAAVAFVGFADSAYLTADHYFALPLPCSLTSGCETVLHSAYSTVGPIPLAALGVAFYLLVLFLALYLYTAAALDKRLVFALFGFGVIGFGMSIVFESIQVFIIHAICQYCALSALCSTLLCIVGVMLLRVTR